MSEASSENAGEITYFEDTLESCICIYKNRSWRWEKIEDLSPENFKKHKAEITSSIDEMLRDRRKKPKVKYEPPPIEFELMKELFEKLNYDERATIAIKYSNTKLSKKFCTVCRKFINKKTEKYKCLHRQVCPGMCKECNDSMKKEFLTIPNPKQRFCTACGQYQLKECPICQEDLGSDFFAFFNDCSHSCCWKCITQSHFSNNPLKNCPECREEININFN